MADQRIFGLDIPSPNVALDTLRIGIVDALEELKNGGANTDDLFLLMDMVLSLTDSVFADIAALTARIEALESQPEPPPEPAPEPAPVGESEG